MGWVTLWNVDTDTLLGHITLYPNWTVSCLLTSRLFCSITQCCHFVFLKNSYDHTVPPPTPWPLEDLPWLQNQVQTPSWPLRSVMMWPQPTVPILRSSTPFNKSCPELKPSTSFLLPTSYIFPAVCHFSSSWWQSSPFSLYSKSYCSSKSNLIVLSFMEPS